jgi:mannosyl-3-phosphoglycerate synthase
MRFENTRIAEHLGSVKLYGVRRLLELDSGAAATNLLKDDAEIQQISAETMQDIERRLVIVLPIMNEDLKVFESALSGIPRDCLMIVVSNSRSMTDVFKSEGDILSRFCNATRRQSLIVHQKDPTLAQALIKAGYPEIVGDDGLIRNGKSEGMILGIMLALLSGREYIGFIDTDNYIPGAVCEYVKHYAFGFSLAKSPYAMVRILWRYKPKVMGELYFRKWGRVSEITNKYLNHMLSTKGRFETEIIKTANAGEHAMSLELAKNLSYGSSYAVETQELISMLEQFGGILPVTNKDIAEKGVEVIQTETINPHLHAEKGDEHLFQGMLLPSLSVIYHSQLCEESTRNLILKELVDAGGLKENEAVPKVRLLPPPQKADLTIFAESIESEMKRYSVPETASILLRSTRAKQVTEAKRVIITDLDGTLLHPQTYSYTQALDALRQVQTKEIPIVFCSAKTRYEQQFYREELGIKAPFIVENGGAIYIHKDYFRFSFSYDKAVQDYLVIELGMPYRELKHKLSLACDTASQQIKANEKLGKINITSFGDMTAEDIAKETGLSLKLANFAKQREYSETLKIVGDRKAVDVALSQIKEAGLNYTFGGRFYEVMGGNNDKGRAVKILLEIFRLNLGNITTIGIGDSMNDQPMLANVNLPILVQSLDRKWQKLKIRNLKKVKGVGPEGWSQAIAEYVKD